MNKKNILIIDDEELFAESLTADLNESERFQASFITDHHIEKTNKQFDYIFIDLRLINFSGLNLIEPCLERFPSAEVFLMTGFGTISSAVEAMKLGASDYVTKPINLQKVSDLIDHKLEANIREGELSLDRVEREYIEHILAKEKGNISNAAKKLGIHRQSLQRKLKKWVPKN
jgi:two-component system response regulator RegA